MRYDIIAGLKGVQQGVEKSLWEAQQASEAVDAADDKLARLMADLEALDTEKDQAAITLKQKEVEASQPSLASAGGLLRQRRRLNVKETGCHQCAKHKGWRRAHRLARLAAAAVAAERRPMVSRPRNRDELPLGASAEGPG